LVENGFHRKNKQPEYAKGAAPSLALSPFSSQYNQEVATVLRFSGTGDGGVPTCISQLPDQSNS